MAAKVGTSTTGGATGNANSIATAAKSTTTGNLISVELKWEWAGTGSAPVLTSVTDTAGNSYTIEQNLAPTASTPGGAIAWAKNITGDASNVVTANFNNATASYRRIIQTEWSGLDTTSPVDGTSQQNTGSGNTFSTAAITTTTSGVMVYAVAGYQSLTFTAAGTPTSTLDATTGESCSGYYISSTGQSITPGATATGTADAWVMQAVAFKDAGGGGASRPVKMAGEWGGFAGPSGGFAG